MKRGIIFGILVLMLSSFVVAAPPSFHIFSGYIKCAGDGFVDGESLSLVVFNGSDSFTRTVPISNGLYSVLIDADTSYTINFSADGVYLNQFDYEAYGFSENVNFTLGTDHSFCSVVPTCSDGIQNGDETGVDCGGSCPACGGGGGPGGGGGDDDEETCGDGDVNQASESCDGSDLNGKTCVLLGFNGGVLSCRSNCTFNTVACTGIPPTSYCGDGTCQVSEDCSSCPQDCGNCGGDWELTGVEVDMDQSEIEEVVSVGGDYDLIIGGADYPFSVYDVTSESVSIDVNGETYVIPIQGTQNIFVGGYDFEASYLETQDGKAKLSLRKIGLRGVTPYPMQDVVYFIVGALIVGVGLFFGIRYLTRGVKQDSNLSKSKKQNLLAGPEE